MYSPKVSTVGYLKYLKYKKIAALTKTHLTKTTEH